MTVITEAELREAWQNGKGAIPIYPAGTRFTPAAQDFLNAHRSEDRLEAAQSPFLSGGMNALPPGRVDLHAPSGPKVIYTGRDVEELARAGVTSLVMTPEMYLTDIAREKLSALGIRIVLTSDATRPPAGGAEVSRALQPERKSFYTESDVIELARGGMTVLRANRNAVFTASAQERLTRLGIRVLREEIAAVPATTVQEDLFQIVKRAVQARLGGQVNESVLDVVIRNVLARLTE